jgi:TM2 domain-containing membrane protein YozV
MDPLDAEQEAIDAAVAELPATQRQEFYDRAAERFKDPDTYSTLCYMFIAGLHHFYLNRWGRGAIDLSFNFAGFLIVGVGIFQNRLPTVLFGAAIILAMAISELTFLFRSPSIVKRYNLDTQREILGALRSDFRSLPTRQ